VGKIKINPNVFIYPMPVALLGAMAGQKPNFMTVAWFNRVNAEPPMLMVAVHNSHLTCEGIKTSKAFSLNFPSASLIKKTDHCGIVSGRTKDKSSLFTVFVGDLNNVPMIVECPLSIECKLADMKELPTNTLFIGEIVSAYADQSCLTNNQLNIKKMNSFVLTMPDNNYWSIGNNIGKAWRMGEDIK